MLISVSHNTIVSNKHEEQTRHYYVNFQHVTPQLAKLLITSISLHPTLKGSLLVYLDHP